ncbi:MAG: pyridoxamine 5'-phosphate oxidase [Crocinitomicaceae bacterium]|nr:pyridoxamine 5'-phosphate oxidase [Crocinitomicaceae bacterium]
MSDLTQALRDDHHSFDIAKLDEIKDGNPFTLFEKWMQHAIDSNCLEANACIIATVDANNQPSSRIVYLKELIDDQFVFYTNYHSHKGKDIAFNNKISMQFFWPLLQQQIRIEGSVEKIDEKISDDYFQSRPWESKIGAWASHQSEKLSSREELEQRIDELSKKYPTDVPRPPHWGGYALTPNKIEFWQGRASRLHDRFVFEKNGTNWSIFRLNP